MKNNVLQGPDYDSANEEEIAVERARLCALLRDWETASTSSSLNRSAPSTPAHRKLPSKPQGPPPSPYYHPQLNGELFLQQQNQQLQLQQQYFQHQLQYQQNMRGQFMVSCSPQITRVAPVMRNYQPVSPVPMQQHASSVVQYRQSRGSYTELAWQSLYPFPHRRLWTQDTDVESNFDCYDINQRWWTDPQLLKMQKQWTY